MKNILDKTNYGDGNENKELVKIFNSRFDSQECMKLTAHGFCDHGPVKLFSAAIIISEDFPDKEKAIEYLVACLKKGVPELMPFLVLYLVVEAAQFLPKRYFDDADVRNALLEINSLGEFCDSSVREIAGKLTKI
jgi:hypothetical protein